MDHTCKLHILKNTLKVIASVPGGWVSPTFFMLLHVSVPQGVKNEFYRYKAKSQQKLSSCTFHIEKYIKQS